MKTILVPFAGMAAVPDVVSRVVNIAGNLGAELMPVYVLDETEAVGEGDRVLDAFTRETESTNVNVRGVQGAAFMSAVRLSIIESVRQILREKRENILRLLSRSLDSDRQIGQLEFGSRFSRDGFDDYLQAELSRTEDALQRIREGSFGECRRCRGEIEGERLEVVPFAHLCVRCRRQQNSISGRGSAQWN